MIRSDRQLTESLTHLFRSGRDAMFITDEQGNFTHVNQAFLKLYGYREEDIIGKPIGRIKSRLHDDGFYQQVEAALKEQGHWSGDIRNIRANGEIIHVWTQLLQSSEGITGLQVNLQERDAEVRRMQQLSRLESVSTLAGGIAHEFNNILAGIQGHLHLLKRRIPNEDTREQERLQRINGLLGRAGQLVQNLLMFSRQKTTNSKQASLGQTLEETTPLIRAMLSSSIELDIQIIDKGMFAMLDPVQLRNILLELAANAVYAFRQNRIDHPKIIISLRRAGEMAEIRVRDNAGGMQDEVMQHCLEPFYTTKPVGEGTGLGLSAANGYIGQLEGKLEILQNDGPGTDIVIQLPLGDNEPTCQINAATQTILLADDDQDIRQSVAEILEYHGYQVIQARNGQQALELWQENPQRFGALLLDIVMPELDGIEVANRIRQVSQDLPICMMTGYSHRMVSSELKVHLLRKPVDPSLLLQYLKNLGGQ